MGTIKQGGRRRRCPERGGGRRQKPRNTEMKPGNLSDPPAESGLETNAPTSLGTAASPYKPSPLGTGQNRALPICHLPRKSSAPCISSATNSALEITFFFYPKLFFFSSARVSPLTHPRQLMVASFGGLLCVSLQSRDAEPGLVGAGGWPAQSLTLARPRGRGRPRGEWQRGEGAG